MRRLMVVGNLILTRTWLEPTKGTRLENPYVENGGMFTSDPIPSNLGVL